VDCFESRKLMQVHADGELDVMDSAALESHLRGCAACAAASQAWQAQRGVIAGVLEQHRAPAALRARIEALTGLAGESRGAQRPRWRPWPVLWPALAGCALGVMLTAGGMLAWQARTQEGQAEASLINAHVRSLMAENHLTDVLSGDRHSVRPWFAGRLDFSPPVPDLSLNGYALVGGRVDHVAGRPAAALVYRARKHVINVFVARGHGGGEAAPVRRGKDGFAMVRWSRDGLDYVAVSDMNVTELAEFAALLAQAS
jgi:anti-sigma factor RsiW